LGENEVKRIACVVAAIFAIALAGTFDVLHARAPQGAPAQGAQAAGNQASQASPEAVERGRQQFRQACAACHAEDATGGRGPDLVRSSLVRRDKNGDLIAPVVTMGRTDRGMPSFTLTEAQMSDIAAFLRGQVALFDLHTRTPGGYPNDIPAERLATGSVEAGKAYFNGAGGCSQCHSPTGDLAGVAKKYDPQNLQSRFLYPSGATVTLTVTLPSGEKFEGAQIVNDEDNVGIVAKDGWYHSWPRSAVKSVEIHDPLVAHRELLLHKYTTADIHNLFTYLETLK
jgi:cytochrome c oxidase cbb3-type subunit III